MRTFYKSYINKKTISSHMHYGIEHFVNEIHEQMKFMKTEKTTS